MVGFKVYNTIDLHLLLNQMDYFPIFLSLKNKPCLVVGAGAVALRKIELLLKAEAAISVIAPEISSGVTALQQRYPLEIKQRPFQKDDVKAFQLIVSATNLLELNKVVAEAATAHEKLINVVDSPELSSFIFPAIIDRSPIIAAVSSGGASPVLARLLRMRIESLIPAAYAQLARLAGKYRNQVKQAILIPAQRRIFWEYIFQGGIAELIFAGKHQQAEQQLLEQIDSYENNLVESGAVYLVGAGPGDPDLLTFRALRLMQQADVVVYDRLVSDAILELVRRDAEKIYVGKQRQDHTLGQNSINALLARLAQAGKRVVRLKGGDPFIFGRGGEEMQTLMAEGVNFQIIPGITAASGCASYAGIPLTHRDHAQSCTFVTGHLKDGSIDLNWQQLAAPNQTLVIYMGLVGLSKICQQLIAHGSPGTMPIALIQQGTTAAQQVFIDTLATLPGLVEDLNIKPPTLIIIGTVVNLHNQLAWFNTE